jgi:hypothetical protein
MYKTRIKAWGLMKYTKRRQNSHARLAFPSKPPFETAPPGREARISNRVKSHAPENASCDMTDAPVEGGSVSTNSLFLAIGFDQQIDHFLRTTMVYLQFAAQRESWRSVPSILVSRDPFLPCPIPESSQACSTEPTMEWELNAFDRPYRLESFFFDEIMTSVCYATRADYQNAGDCWRSAFHSVETAIDREDPELLVALMWSVSLLHCSGYKEVVMMLQDYLLRLVRLRANRSHPLLPVLHSFARIPQSKILPLRRLVLGIISDWSTEIFKEDASVYKIYYWSSLPSADGRWRIASSAFAGFKNGPNGNRDLVGSNTNGNIGERLIFVARRKRALRLRPGEKGETRWNMPSILRQRGTGAKS